MSSVVNKTMRKANTSPTNDPWLDRELRRIGKARKKKVNLSNQLPSTSVMQQDNTFTQQYTPRDISKENNTTIPNSILMNQNIAVMGPQNNPVINKKMDDAIEYDKNYWDYKNVVGRNINRGVKNTAKVMTDMVLPAAAGAAAISMAAPAAIAGTSSSLAAPTVGGMLSTMGRTVMAGGAADYMYHQQMGVPYLGDALGVENNVGRGLLNMVGSPSTFIGGGAINKVGYKPKPSWNGAVDDVMKGVKQSYNVVQDKLKFNPIKKISYKLQNKLSIDTGSGVASKDLGRLTRHVENDFIESVNKGSRYWGDDLSTDSYRVYLNRLGNIPKNGKIIVTGNKNTLNTMGSLPTTKVVNGIKTVNKDAIFKLQAYNDRFTRNTGIELPKIDGSNLFKSKINVPEIIYQQGNRSFAQNLKSYKQFTLLTGGGAVVPLIHYGVGKLDESKKQKIGLRLGNKIINLKK